MKDNEKINYYTYQEIYTDDINKYKKEIFNQERTLTYLIFFNYDDINKYKFRSIIENKQNQLILTTYADKL